MQSERLGRFESLDVLRGFAAVIVLVFHFLTVLYQPHPAAWSPLRFFLAGHQAVIMFFVLSGFALTCMIKNMTSFALRKYVGARIVRLYPPYILSIAFSLAVFGTLTTLGAQWQAGHMDLLKPHLTLHLALGHALMIGVFDMGAINPNIWSLVYEMRISLLFPLIFWMVSKYGIRAVATFAMLSILYWARYQSVDWKWPATTASNLLETFHYATFFAMGAWIAIHHNCVVAYVKSLSRLKTVIAWVASIALFTYSFSAELNVGYRALLDLVSGVASSSILALSLDMQRTIIFRLGKWLGKISYSLYLTHVPILHASVILFYSSKGVAFTGIFALVASFLFAVGYNYIIEIPTIRFGRKILKPQVTYISEHKSTNL